MRDKREVSRRSLYFLWALALLLCAPLAVSAQATGTRYPGEAWMRYASVEEAGFDPAKLEAARATWEAMPSSAFLVISDGAVVASWGDVGRRFMCHSVRKSFLSALYGIYWDRGEIDLNKTLADLGIDDWPDPLLESERQARILDLLKARSGVFHPAAYAGRTDSRPRGSEGPGRYFAYNNWDFNTSATILMQETGDDVFEAFDEYFGGPLQMEDWRVSDGYYHYELDKSRYPAYPFRLSARDAARFGLLFARYGMWDESRILSEHWVNRSSALYSIDTDIMGYGFYWWILRQPPFLDHGMYAALGVGNQFIAVLPKSDMVIVNRANTYDGESTPMPQLLGLVQEILEARTGTPSHDPTLMPLEVTPDPLITSRPHDQLGEFAGEWPYPPVPLGEEAEGAIRVTLGDGHLVVHHPFQGTFKLYLQPDGSFHMEDALETFMRAWRSVPMPLFLGGPLKLFLGVLLALFLVGCGGEGSGGDEAAQTGNTVAVVGGWLWDGTENQPEPNRGILIQDSLFVRVGSELRGSDLAGATLIQLTQEDFILPGLFDLHAHYAVDLYGEGRVDEDQVYPALFLANGVTNTYPAGEIDPVKMQALRARIENGEQEGPRLFNSGPYFGTARQGWNREITPQEIRSEVDHWYAQGVRNFKAKGIRAGPLQALIDAAHAHGATVTAHLDSGYRSSVNPRDAIAMGLDRVEHFLGGDAMTPDRSAYASLMEMTPDMPEVARIAQLYMDKGVYFDATLSAYGYYGERDPEVYTYFEAEMDYLTPEARAAVESRLPRRVNQQFERIYWAKRDLIKAFYDMGGGDLITLGTDHPSWGEYFSPFSTHR
jgi:CubicO group peptidase (beta-lactamase class C family)